MADNIVPLEIVDRFATDHAYYCLKDKQSATVGQGSTLCSDSQGFHDPLGDHCAACLGSNIGQYTHFIFVNAEKVYIARRRRHSRKKPALCHRGKVFRPQDNKLCWNSYPPRPWRLPANEIRPTRLARFPHCARVSRNRMAGNAPYYNESNKSAQALNVVICDAKQGNRFLAHRNKSSAVRRSVVSKRILVSSKKLKTCLYCPSLEDKMNSCVRISV